MSGIYMLMMFGILGFHGHKAAFILSLAFYNQYDA